MSKYVYAEKFNFMLRDPHGSDVPILYHDIKYVMASIQHSEIYIISEPLTSHPYAKSKEEVQIRSSRIKSMEEKDGFW